MVAVPPTGPALSVTLLPVRLIDSWSGVPLVNATLGAPELTAEGVRELAGGKLAHYKIPRYVLIVDEFPMTVTGKIRKIEMREKSVGLLGLEAAAAIRNA